MSKSHENKVILVTGASKGIGKTLCVGLAQHGADIIAVARSRSDEIAKAVEAEGRNIWLYNAMFLIRRLSILLSKKPWNILDILIY